MEEQPKYGFGVDIGTGSVRAVALEINRDGTISVIGFGEERVPSGMRKGIVTDLAGPSETIDLALSKVEKMSGAQIDDAFVSINGSHIKCEKVSGMIAISSGEPITNADIARLQNTAATGRLSNRRILSVEPLNYILDGQGGIRHPEGMAANKVEITENLVTALGPNAAAVENAAMGVGVRPLKMVPEAAASARALLTDHQMENGVAIVNIGAATTSVAIYDEGDMQFTGTIPAGSNNITKDLAISLEINTDVAEIIKMKYATAEPVENDEEKTIKADGETICVSTQDVDRVVKERLKDIFDHVEEFFERAGYAQKLPEGVVLTGGGSRMKGIAGFAKENLKMAARLGSIKFLGLKGVVDEIDKPEYTTALGLALEMTDRGGIAKTTEQEKDEPASLLGGFKRLFKKH